MPLNKEWHRLNRMPPKATRAQRITWHVKHAEACACRSIPEGIRRDVEKLLDERCHDTDRFQAASVVF